MKKKIFAGLMAGLLLLTACGSGGNKSMSAVSTEAYSKSDMAAAGESGFYMTEEAKVAANEGEYGESGGTGISGQAETVNDTARKRIVTYNLSVETEDFDGLISSLEARVNSFGGYFESIDTYNGSKYDGYRGTRHSNITIRVPAKKADEFVQFIGDSANITNKSLSSEDVTLAYVDLQSRKKTYQIEMDRLLALLDKAEKIEDIISLEQRLSDVRYQLESMESQIRTYDNLVDYTAIYLNLNEVKEYSEPEPETYVQRLGRAFVDGWKGFVEWLQDVSIGFAETLPAWIFLAVLVVVIILIVKKLRKKGPKAPKRPSVPQTQVNQNTNEQGNNGQQ